MEGYDDFHTMMEIYILWTQTATWLLDSKCKPQMKKWYTLIGPESDSYGTAPAQLSITYFSGAQAIAQEAEIEDDTTLADLVDLSQHNDDVIEDALEDALAEYDNGDGGSETTEEEIAEETEGGLLPFVSPVFTIAMIAIAGLVASLQGRKDQARIETLR